MFKQKGFEEDVGIIFRDQTLSQETLENIGTIQPLIFTVANPKCKKKTVQDLKSSGIWGPSTALWIHPLEGSRVLASLLSHNHTAFAFCHTILARVQDTPRHCEAGSKITNAGRAVRVSSTSPHKLWACYFIFFFFFFILLHLGSCDSCGFPSGCRAGESQISSVCNIEGLLHATAVKDRCATPVLISWGQGVRNSKVLWDVNQQYKMK